MHRITQIDILKIIHEDAWMMDVLKAAQTLGLPDWWIGAGFVRNKVWDVLHNYKRRTPLHDIDLIYFDPTNTSEEVEKNYEKRLKKLFPNTPWSVKNQARMHMIKGDKPYKNSIDGLSRWVETATCIGVTLDKNDKLKLAAPHGIMNLTRLVLRPVKGQESMFEIRLNRKNWLTKWPKLKILRGAAIKTPGG